MPQTDDQSDESLLLERCRRWDEAAAQQLVARYHRPVYGFILSLLGCSRNEAREMATTGIVAAVQGIREAPRGSSMWRVTLPALLERCRRVTAVPSDGFPEGLAGGPTKPELLRLIRQALLALPFDLRAALLLRDQLHLPYDEIGAAAGADAKQARADVTAARTQLRERLRDLAGRQRL